MRNIFRFLAFGMMLTGFNVFALSFDIEPMDSKDFVISEDGVYEFYVKFPENVEWTESVAIFFIDDKKIYTLPNEPGQDRYPYDDKAYCTDF